VAAEKRSSETKRLRDFMATQTTSRKTAAQPLYI
jgi:hypothetical protein